MGESVSVHEVVWYAEAVGLGEDIVVGERLQNLLSLADLSPSFVRHAATLKQRSHVSAQAHEKAKRVAAERAARESAALRQQERVDFRLDVICFGSVQVAWAALVIGATPAIMSGAGQSIDAAVGHLVWWVVPAMCGSNVLLCYCLAVFRAVFSGCDEGIGQPAPTTSGRVHAGHLQVFGLELRGRR